jgi:hypothetical protein
MPRSVTFEPSYYALRAGAEGSPWWEGARRAGPDAPPPIRALLAGRSRVEVSPDEAWSVLTWARKLDGWESDDVTPLWIYPIAPPDTNRTAGDEPAITG